MIQSSVKMNILSKDDIKENKIVDNMQCILHKMPYTYHTSVALLPSRNVVSVEAISN